VWREEEECEAIHEVFIRPLRSPGCLLSVSECRCNGGNNIHPVFRLILHLAPFFGKQGTLSHWTFEQTFRTNGFLVLCTQRVRERRHVLYEWRFFET
jgi:hypothetical protein